MLSLVTDVDRKEVALSDPKESGRMVRGAGAKTTGGLNLPDANTFREFSAEPCLPRKGGTGAPVTESGYVRTR